jgi:AcrR family transcriptional regulator
MTTRVRKRAATYHHPDLRSAAVLVATAALDRGAGLPTLRALAERCGVSHPALYRHFAARDGLILAVGAHSLREAADAVLSAFRGVEDPLAALHAGCLAHVGFWRARPRRFELVWGPALAGKAHVEEWVGAARAYFGDLVDAIARCGVPDPVPVAHTATCAMHGFIDLANKGRTIPLPAASPDAQLDALWHMIEAHVRASSKTRVRRP